MSWKTKQKQKQKQKDFLFNSSTSKYNRKQGRRKKRPGELTLKKEKNAWKRDVKPRNGCKEGSRDTDGVMLYKGGWVTIFFAFTEFMKEKKP